MIDRRAWVLLHGAVGIALVIAGLIVGPVPMGAWLSLAGTAVLLAHLASITNVTEAIRRADKGIWIFVAAQLAVGVLFLVTCAVAYYVGTTYPPNLRWFAYAVVVGGVTGTVAAFYALHILRKDYAVSTANHAGQGGRGYDKRAESQ